MIVFQTTNDGTAELSSGALRAFMSRFRGALISEEDQGYDVARRVWNGLIDKRPALIARCAGTDDAAMAVAFARDHGLLLDRKSVV